jgi:hypothetical protein
MAQATRIVHCEVPSLGAALVGKFIEEWNVAKPIPEVVADACKYIHTTPMDLPPAELFYSIAKSLAKGLNEYSISGRQLDSLMRLLTASYNIEKRGLHEFSALDLGRLATSIIPLKLAKTKFSIQPDMLAIQLAKHLTDNPWKQAQTETYQTASVAVEAAQQKYGMASLDELLMASKAGGLDGFVAFEALLKKIVADRAWDVPIDNFTKW